MPESSDVQDHSDNQHKWSKKQIARCVLIAILAVVFGFAHYKYVATLFENDRRFSYLSDLEREMSLRTEMGFYYSYYKTVVEEKSFTICLTKIVFDKLVEYPKDVNAFNRFNINQEVLIGSLYRYFEPWLNSSYRECHMIERGDDHAPVESCVGIGQPVYFYLEAIWLLAGLTVAVLFLHATTLSHSILGGVLAVVQYFANHAECTRVQWAPNERENFAVPLLLLQTWFLTLQLRTNSKNNVFKLQVGIFITNCLCLLFWQFTQFIFLSQAAIFFVMEQFRIIDAKTLSIFLHSHFCGLHTAILFLQGNDMLKTSLYTSSFVIISIYCIFFSGYRLNIKNKFDLFMESFLVILRILVAVTCTLYLKKFICDFFEIKDDSHIWDIVYSKLTNYKTFHTLIYTCSDVFDFLPMSSILNMTYTLLIPLVVLSCVNAAGYWEAKAISVCRQELDDILKADKAVDGDDDDSGIENNSETALNHPKDLDVMMSKLHGKMFKFEQFDGVMVLFMKHFTVDAAIFYQLSQMIVYGVMAFLVMRLKLLFATQMCIVCSLIANKDYSIVPKSLKKYVPIFWIIAILPIARELSRNITTEMSHVGEFSDYPQEELLQWIKAEAKEGAFAGSMPLLSSVMLSTRRPIVAHPHYEHVEARKRAYSVYKVYGKFSAEDYYEELNKLKAIYLVIETKYCYGEIKKGCSFEAIWDIEYPNLKTNPKLCHTLLTEPVDHFYPLFRNVHYAVFKVHDVGVRPPSYGSLSCIEACTLVYSKCR